MCMELDEVEEAAAKVEGEGKAASSRGRTRWHKRRGMWRPRRMRIKRTILIFPTSVIVIN